MENTAKVLKDCTAVARQHFIGAAAGLSCNDAAFYLAHTGQGQSIRALAEAVGTHPSTVMRAVHRVESQRDDPLYDRALGEVEADAVCLNTTPRQATKQKQQIDDKTLETAARRFLRRLCEPGAFLMTALGAEKCGIFCKTNKYRKPIAMVKATIAVSFLKRDWIRASERGQRSVRYYITERGRDYLRSLLAEQTPPQQQPGFADAQTPFLAQHQIMGARILHDPDTGDAKSFAVNLGESPLGWLARRKDARGRPFLTEAELEAGEQLRNDFELAQIGPSVTQNWREFLTPGTRMSGMPCQNAGMGGSAAARERVTRALGVLGPGLADVALRVCCFLEGLETCERRMGWSARSGKVVLKIALQRLAAHYGINDLHTAMTQ